MSVFQNSEKNSRKEGTQAVLGFERTDWGGLFKHVKFGQVRKAIKSFKSEALRPPVNLLARFGRKFERTVFKRMTLSPILKARNNLSITSTILGSQE
jgi:hypothetical protein